MAKIYFQQKNGKMGFEAHDEKGHVVRIDSSMNHGGEDYGASPMQLLLFGLGGCSAIDVVSILKKMQQEIEDFQMVVEGEREKEVIPAVWVKAHIRFILRGKIEREKAEKAAKLSIEKYCSVAETLRRAGCIITWNIELQN